MVSPTKCSKYHIDSHDSFFSMKFLGDLVYVKNFTERTVFVNTYDTAVELFDKKGVMYNSRPRLVMCNELYVNFLSVPQFDSLIDMCSEPQARLGIHAISHAIR